MGSLYCLYLCHNRKPCAVLISILRFQARSFMKSVTVVWACFILVGCVGSEDWPQLSNPLPNKEDRDRQITPIPVPPPVIARALEEPPGEAPARLQDIERAVTESLTAFEDAVATLQKAQDAEERSIAWRSAQFALSRVSGSLLPLMRALDTGHFGDIETPEYQDAFSALKRYRALIADATARLADLNPNS